MFSSALSCWWNSYSLQMWIQGSRPDSHWGNTTTVKHLSVCHEVKGQPDSEHKHLILAAPRLWPGAFILKGWNLWRVFTDWWSWRRASHCDSPVSVMSQLPPRFPQSQVSFINQHNLPFTVRTQISPQLTANRRETAASSSDGYTKLLFCQCVLLSAHCDIIARVLWSS